MRIYLIVLLFSFSNSIFAQKERVIQAPDYGDPKEYTLGGISVTGTTTVNPNIVIALSGLTQGQQIQIPGTDITNAIKKLWDQRLFSDVGIYIEQIIDNQVFLSIEVQARPRLTEFSIEGARRNDKNNLRDKLKLNRGDIVTEQFMKGIEKTILDYYKDKGFPNPDININKRSDTLFAGNSVQLRIEVDRGERVRIKSIDFEGNEVITDRRLRRAMKNHKQRQRLNVFRQSKYMPEKMSADIRNIEALYREKGYRDAHVSSDTAYYISDKLKNIRFTIDEGNRYYFRNITWSGNTKHSSETLSGILGIEKGDVYNATSLNKRLFGNPQGRDVSSLYMDDGYLFFNMIPTETSIENDSIDIQIRIVEGPQATINRISFSGNTKTNDHVIQRELRTRPGEKFSRSDIMRSQRELQQLGYFDHEHMDIIPTPNPEDGTVDIEYKLRETHSDQLELSGGWGAGQLLGTLGVSFNNFSARNMFTRGAWQPLPSGDGQRLSLRAQSNGRWYQSYNFSFTEPWFGGRRPNSLSYSVYHSIQSNGRERGHPDRQDIRITGTSLGLGKRLTIPDDWFTLHNSISFQHYKLNNYRALFAFSEGSSNNLFLTHRLSRNSLDYPIYPRSGSRISLALQWTPPYSLFRDQDEVPDLTPQERYKWLEYHKWTFESSFFNAITDKLVIHSKVHMGFLGLYNRDMGIVPFERYYLGGDGLSGYSLDGREIIGLRGYDNNSLQPQNGGTILSKYTLELRYPLTLNPTATIYVLAFAEAGNSWSNFRYYDPFDVYRSAGAGVRIFMPMFGLIGFDWGYGFDVAPGRTQPHGHDFHISIGQNF